jgi:hypothetical protein
MAQAKMETAAARYRRIKAETEAKQGTDAATCSCGMEWQVRRQPLDFWVTSGILPAQLAATYMKFAKTGKADEASLMSTLNEEQVLQSVEFTSKVVRHTAIEPKIVEKPTEPTEIGYDEVMTCCYATIRDWQFTGGDEAARLGKFPQE